MMLPSFRPSFGISHDHVLFSFTGFAVCPRLQIVHRLSLPSGRVDAKPKYNDNNNDSIRRTSFLSLHSSLCFLVFISQPPHLSLKSARSHYIVESERTSEGMDHVGEKNMNISPNWMPKHQRHQGMGKKTEAVRKTLSG